MKTTVATFRAAKGQRKLTMLTCYDYSMAKIMNMADIDCLLVGDSLGMVMLGYANTVPVTMEDMIHHCRAVAKGADNALILCDMPFMSSQCGIDETLRNAGRLLKEGFANAVKLEGGLEFAPEVAALTRASIPVMAHIGLMPQSINSLGTYRVQGKSAILAQKALDDAIAMEQAGAFALLLECVPAPLAELITASVDIPTIGIGAGPHCDGQVLVWQDMLGVTDGKTPKFARRFAEIGKLMAEAFREYANDVRNGAFPAPEHSYDMNGEVLATVKTPPKRT